jgi:CubicO group peptidase (beta-lactamase class C family)
MPGFALGIINPNGTTDYYMFGEMNRKTGEPPTKDTIFLAASLTKTVTATAILQLWEQGKIDLDTDVSTYLPFDLRHPDYPDTTITIRLMLTHSSGLSNVQWRSFTYFSLLHFPLAWYEYYLTPGNRFYYANNWNEYPPGEGLYYSSIAYDLLAYIVECVSGEPFPDYCETHIFEPLEMKNTSMRLSDVSYDQLAHIYLNILGVYIEIPYYEIENDGSGGMLSTVEDICHYLSMHMNQGTFKDKQILNPETVEMMHTVQFPDLPGYDVYKDGRNYGLGWIYWPDDNFTYNKGMQGHLGNIPGALASMTVLNNTGVVFFGNEWSGLNYLQTGIMFMLREYFHTKTKPMHENII